MKTLDFKLAEGREYRNFNSIERRESEDGEKIELRPKTWDEIDAMIDAEEIVDAKTLVALLTARRKLER